MFEHLYNGMTGDAQLLMLDVVGNPIFRNMLNELAAEAQVKILELNAEEKSAEDFRISYAVAQKEFELITEFYQAIENVRLDLEQRMQ